MKTLSKNDCVGDVRNKELFDCIISCGELDPDWYGHFLDNEHRKCEVVKHAVTKEEVETWLHSDECYRRVKELRSYGKRVFGRDYWLKFHVNYYYTMAKA